MRLREKVLVPLPSARVQSCLAQQLGLVETQSYTSKRGGVLRSALSANSTDAISFVDPE